MCSVDGRLYLPENRRVKAWGAVIMALAIPGSAWLSNHPLADRWLSGTTSDLIIAAAVFLVSVNLATVGALVLASGLAVLRPWRDPRGRSAAVLLLVGANCGIPVIGFSLLQEDATVSGLADQWVVLALGVAFLLFVTVIQTFRRSQQWDALSAEEALRRDPRAPVLYLRAFTDDGLMSVRGHNWQDRVLGKAAGALTLTSPEQELAFILQRVGPVVAIGKPGERLPELGAARVYVSHDSWQQTVLEMLERSSLVLARVGASPGVLWELDQVLSRAQRSKVVLLVLGSAEDQAAGVRAIEARIGQPLPLVAATPLPFSLAAAAAGRRSAAVDRRPGRVRRRRAPARGCDSDDGLRSERPHTIRDDAPLRGRTARRLPEAPHAEGPRVARSAQPPRGRHAGAHRRRIRRSLVVPGITPARHPPAPAAAGHLADDAVCLV